MIPRLIILGLVGGATLLALSSCGSERVHEPWDSTGYFDKYRVRTDEQRRQLQERVLHTQGRWGQEDRGSHETREFTGHSGSAG